MNPSNYRSDIDGLRTFAVLPVVIYHAMPKLLPGGYLGVDVFFVISGYLITLLLMREISSGTFRFRNFYRRRILRLAPAFIAMISVSLTLGGILYLPGEYIRLGVTTVYSLLALSNLYFARNSSYFDPDTDKNPLLHTWSLAVEEQFYLVFPLVIFTFMLWQKRVIPFVFSGLFVASLMTMLWLVARDPDSSYYLPYTRAWQLLAGSILAYWHLTAPTRQFSPLLGKGLVAAGLCLLALSYVLISSKGGHPGPAMLVPVLGTLFIIAGGHRKTKGTREFLAARPLVLTGLASYSIYLWHQPIIVFYEEWTLSTPGYVDIIFMVLASLIVGFASWHYIEKPTRNSPASFTRIFSRFLTANTALVIAALYIIATNGIRDRLPDDVIATASYSHPLKTLSRDCHISKDESFTFTADALCEIPGDDDITIAVWGSSHGASLASGLLALDPAPTIIQGSVSGCHPLVKATSWNKNGVDCNRAHKIIGTYFTENEDIDIVVIHSRWATLSSFSKQEGRDLLHDSVQKILDSGKRVILVGSVPEQEFDVPRRMAKTLLRQGPEAVEKLGVSRTAFETRQSDAHAAIKALPPHANLLKVFLDDVYCTRGAAAYCPVADGLTPLYFDDDHLGVEGAQLAAEYIRQTAKRNGFW